jgi:hypothetical protein
MSKQRCGLCLFWEHPQGYHHGYGACYAKLPHSVHIATRWPIYENDGYECPCFKPLKPKAKERKTGKK